MKNKTSFYSYRFRFCGYDGTLWCQPQENGYMMAGFNKEYRNCGTVKGRAVFYKTAEKTKLPATVCYTWHIWNQPAAV